MHYRNKLLIKYFNVWKIYHNYKIKKLNIEEYISTYNRKRLLKRYFEQFILVVFLYNRSHYINLKFLLNLISSTIACE